MVKPDFLIKGNDYSVEEIAGSEFVISYGGIVETLDLVPGYSTSSLIRKIKRNDQD
jgi:bifunctional ADP-heptose synthase (sugar kinase/adenylyltransferase)